MKKEHLGSSLDDFLREENLLEVSEAIAAKRVIALAETGEELRAQILQSVREMKAGLRGRTAASDQ